MFCQKSSGFYVTVYDASIIDFGEKKLNAMCYTSVIYYRLPLTGVSGLGLQLLFGLYLNWIYTCLTHNIALTIV